MYVELIFKIFATRLQFSTVMHAIWKQDCVAMHSNLAYVRHDSIFTAMLSLLLIQEEQLSVTGKRMFTNWAVKHQNKKT